LVVLQQAGIATESKKSKRAVAVIYFEDVQLSYGIP